jgi:tetratricopeptide (TPR) repeat protein
MKSTHNPSQTHSPSNYEQIISDLNRGATFLDLSQIYLTKEQLNDLAGRIADNSFIGHIIWGTLPKDVGAAVGQIENKLIENNMLYKSHPTDFVHALLSSHSYETSKVGERVEFTTDSKGAPHVNAKYNQYLEDWRVEKVFQPENANDYYSVLYVNDKTHHAVLAHRGTDIPNSLKGKNASLKADLIEILNHNIGVQQAASYVSTKEGLDISENLGYNFSTTGHSLGAWLAELSLYFCHMDFNYYRVKAVTFDSPGSKDQMDVFKSNVDNADTKIRTNQFDTVTYLSAPNIVNICNQHVGTVYRLAPEIKYPEALKKELPAMLPKFVKNIIAQNKYYLDSLLSVSGHSLTPMLDVFNPETGKPYPDKYSLVLDWPHIKHKANTKAAQNLFKGIVDNVPVISSLPKVLKAGAIKTISKLVPSSTISSVSNVIASFLSGDTAMSQLCKTFKHFDLNTYGKGYRVKKDLPSLEKFALSYKAHYKTQTVDSSKARLLTKYKGSIDWYLSQIAKTNAAILEKGLDEVSCKQLSIIKNGFKTERINGKHCVSLIEQHQHNIKSIEQFKEYLARLIEVNPTIKDFLENRAGGTVQIIEVRSHQDDYKGNVIANDLPAKLNNFVGRKDVFSEIDKILASNQIVAINAFAGTGKSSTALEYGYRVEDEGKIVRWFDSDTNEKIEANYRQLASDLGIKLEEINADPKQGHKNLINAVNREINKLGKPILLILDNLEHYKDAEEYLRNLPKKLVKVVITTRDSNMLDNPGQHIRLEPFSKEDAASYIISNLQDRVNNPDIEKLIKLLGNEDGEIIPYRLAKAVGFLKENKLWSVSKYIEHIKENPNIEQAETKLLIESLQGADSVQWLQILQYAAFLDPDSMSIEIFKELLNIDEEQLQESIAKLEKLSLVSLNHKDGVGYLKMHRLAQDEVIKYINGQDSAQRNELHQMLPLSEIQKNLIVSLNNLMPKVANMNKQGEWQVGGLYYPHIQKILDNAKQIMLAETGELYYKLGEYNQYVLCNYKQSLDQHLEALKTYQVVYVKEGNHPDIANSLNNVGIAYEKLGQLEKGLQYKEQALTMYQALYQGNHPSIAESLNSVGIAYDNLGKREKELQYKEQALTMRQALYQGNHPDIANSLNNVGIAYGKLGKIEKLLQFVGLSSKEKELQYKEQALTMYQALYQGNHPDIAESLNDVGIAYEKLGQIEKGLQYQEQALTMRQALYQGNHPDIAESLNNVGIAYHNLGKIEKALQYQEQALTMRQALYQGNHPSIANSLNSVGVAYCKLGDSLKALELCKESYFMRCKLLGKDHPKTQLTKSNISNICFNNHITFEERSSILERGTVNKDIIIVKQQIQSSVLNKIQVASSKGNWSSGWFISKPSILGNWGVKGYLDNNYLEDKLGELCNNSNVKIAQMLCFEAICLGVMSSSQQDFTCVEEFTKAYPRLLKEIIAEHPEYMVDGSIVKLCTKDPATLTRLLGENFSGQGNGEHEAVDPWMEYTQEGMDKLLELRLESADQKDVKTIMPNYIYDGSKESANQLANEISNNLEERSLVVLNLFGKHWVGLVIEKSTEAIDIKYMDSEQEIIPAALKEQLINQITINCPEHNIQFTEAVIEPQKYNNCGPEVIENLTSHLLGWGRTTSQEDAVAIHSALFEDSLMSYGVVPYNSTHSHLLLENT